MNHIARFFLLTLCCIGSLLVNAQPPKGKPHAGQRPKAQPPKPPKPRVSGATGSGREPSGAGTPGSANGGYGAGFSTMIRDAVLSPNGTEAAVIGSDNMIRIWSLRDSSVTARLRSSAGSVQRVAYSPDGRRIIAQLRGGAIELFHLQVDAPGRPLDGAAHVRLFGFSPDGNRIITVSGDGNVQLWSGGGASVAAIEVTERVKSFSFSRDGARLLLLFGSNRVAVYEVEGVRPLLQLHGFEPANSQ